MLPLLALLHKLSSKFIQHMDLRRVAVQYGQRLDSAEKCRSLKSCFYRHTQIVYNLTSFPSTPLSNVNFRFLSNFL